jgi:hypothetical protein
LRYLLITIFLASWACLLGAGPVSSAAVPGLESSLSLDVIYVNANVGEAAGGHTAFRLGDTVFHYQFQENGNFIFVREPWSSFRLVYNELCNRSIFISSIPLTPAVFEKLRYHFSGILIAQQQKLQHLQESRARLQLLVNLINGQQTTQIAGLGFFNCAKSTDPQVVSLRNYIDRVFGSGFRAGETEQVRRKITQLVKALRGVHQLNALLEQLTLQASLKILETGCPLDEAAVILPVAGEAQLSLSEREALQQYGKKLRRSIITLLSSTRPDRGAVLLLQIARLLTVDQSLASGRMLTLDPFSDQARLQAVDNAEISSEIRQQVYTQSLEETAAQRENFCCKSDYPEITYAFLEASRGRLSEVDKVISGAEFIRVEESFQPPSRSDGIALAGLDFIPAQLETVAANLKSQISILEQQVKKEFHYNLFTSNCATELVRSLNLAFKDPAAELQALGGRLEPNADFNFTPFMFYRNVRTTFNCATAEYLTARRLRQLHDLYAGEKSLRVWLRESNTVTSTIYKARSEDTPFLFFTDDGWLLRPLEGAANFSYAALNGLVGILTLPFYGGGHFYQGLRGMFYSLPEIVFGNIRKGTYGSAALTSARATP